MEANRTHKKPAGINPSERAYYRRLAAQRIAQGRPDLAAACMRIANSTRGATR
jgi:hypothetical protein